MAHFIRSFPSKLETALNEEPEFFDRSKYVAPNLFQARIYLLNALAAFMGSCEEAQQRDFIEYVDSLIPLLLDKKVHPLLQTAAIQFVNESLKTALPMHRERVDALYFPLMTDLAQSLGLGSRENEKVDCHPCLETQIYRFFSTWCPVPSDEVLKAIPSLEKLRPFEDVFERKRALLIESPLRENADENGKSELQKRKKDKDRTIILTDFPETPESKKGDLELFGQSLQLVPRNYYFILDIALYMLINVLFRLISKKCGDGLRKA